MTSLSKARILWSMTEKTLEILNNTGFPFQHFCANQIAQIDGYEVSMEVPYTDPPTNGPILGVHGQIDILAVHTSQSDDALVCFIIECKRANEKIKNWILLPNKQQKPVWPTTIFCMEAAGQPQQLSVARNARFPSLGYHEGSDFEYCINGIEMNSHMQAINREPAEKIFKPLQQVAHGSHGYELMFPKVVEGIDLLREPKHSMLVSVPVIVTTANLYLAEFDPSTVVMGDIPANGLDLGQPKPWLSYEYPLPDHQSYEINREDGSVVAVGKRTIFIVNDKYLTEFFAKASDVVLSNEPPRK